MKVVAVEPGAVATEMLGQVDVRGERVIGGMNAEQRGRYAALMHAVIAQARASIPGGAPPEEVGRVIADAIASKRPRTRYTVGRDAAIVVRLVRFLSDRRPDSLLARALKAHQPERTRA